MDRPIFFSQFYLCGLIATFAIALIVGCQHPVNANQGIALPLHAGDCIRAAHVTTSITIDGKLDEPIWRETQAYRLMKMPQYPLTEGGTIRLAWDEKFLYLAAQLFDSDVVAEGDRDGQLHFNLGDVCELFIKPEDDNGYWELYVTPNGHQSAFYFPSRGRRLPSCFATSARPLTVAAQVNGTINSPQDKDIRWTAEMAVPWELLLQTRLSHDAQEQSLPSPATIRWKILVGRYNYSRYIENQEFSVAPMLSKLDFHQYEEYALLELLPFCREQAGNGSVSTNR